MTHAKRFRVVFVGPVTFRWGVEAHGRLLRTFVTKREAQDLAARLNGKARP